MKLGIQILSRREREVIELRSRGMPYKQLAPALGISFFTAKNHAKRAFSKLGVSTSLEAVRMLYI
ncbi:MAG: helix-turn-helix transcriptional regulator [Patescibacteria group bacterium]|nr:helix-turn-helix transcriptional regulator [Patescibacteria group bacterium]